MGVHGLLRALKDAHRTIHVQEYAGYKVGVDASCWLHRGCNACARELCLHGAWGSDAWLNFIDRRIAMFRHFKVEPFLVLDGAPAPCKAETESERQCSRKGNLEKAKAHEQEGNDSAAIECYQKAVEITPDMKRRLIALLKRLRVAYIVAPFEADAQLAYLERQRRVQAIVTEDSDLIPLGGARILLKMDKDGWCSEFRKEALRSRVALDFSGFSHDMLAVACCLSGCDYLRSVPGIGAKRARDLVRQRHSPQRIVQKMRLDGNQVPHGYANQLEDAVLAFRHPWVFCPSAEDFVHHNPVPEGAGTDPSIGMLCKGVRRTPYSHGQPGVDTERVRRLVGDPPPSSVAKAVAGGSVDPVSLEYLPPVDEPSDAQNGDDGAQRTIHAFFGHGSLCPRKRRSSGEWEAEAALRRSQALANAVPPGGRPSDSAAERMGWNDPSTLPCLKSGEGGPEDTAIDRRQEACKMPKTGLDSLNSSSSRKGTGGAPLASIGAVSRFFAKGEAQPSTVEQACHHHYGRGDIQRHRKSSEADDCVQGFSVKDEKSQAERLQEYAALAKKTLDTLEKRKRSAEASADLLERFRFAG